MDEVTVTAHAGRPTGSRASNRLRHQGQVPGILYGHGISPVPLAVEGKDLRAALNTESGTNALLTLDVDGTRHLAMARQIQHDAVKGVVSHVDFQVVRRDEVVTAEVPIHLVGEAAAVHAADGLVSQELFHLAIHAKATDIPAAVEVDVSGLAIGDTIRLGDVKLPGGVATEVDPETAVVVGAASRVVEGPEEAAEGAAAEGEGGGETAGDAGEAPDAEAASTEG